MKWNFEYNMKSEYEQKKGKAEEDVRKDLNEYI